MAARKTTKGETLFLLALEATGTDDQEWLFRERTTALAWLKAYLRSDQKAGCFAPGELSAEVQDGCPRKGIAKIISWVDQHDAWPYDDETWFLLSEVAVVEGVPPPQRRSKVKPEVRP